MRASAAGGKTEIILQDLDDCLTEAEEAKLLEKMRATSDKVGINIGIVITADLKGRGAVSYANNFSDKNFGKESDSIVLLLLNTHDLPVYDGEYDRISTSGKAIELFDTKNKRIFDHIYDALEDHNVKSDLPSKPNVYKNWSSANYYVGCMNFCSSVEKYGNPASAFWYGILEFVVNNLGVLFMGLVIGVIVSVIFALSIKKSYTKKSPISAAQYIDKRNTNITRREDIYIREYTTSYRRSSSSGGRSGGGGHSGGGGGHGGASGHHR